MPLITHGRYRFHTMHILSRVDSTADFIFDASVRVMQPLKPGLLLTNISFKMPPSATGRPPCAIMRQGRLSPEFASGHSTDFSRSSSMIMLKGQQCLSFIAGCVAARWPAAACRPFREPTHTYAYAEDASPRQLFLLVTDAALYCCYLSY